jgi:hypothetical protein
MPTAFFFLKRHTLQKMAKKQYGIFANCRGTMEITNPNKSLCSTCEANLPTAKFNSRIK